MIPDPDERRLQRTRALASFDGWSLVALSTPAGLYGLASRQWPIALIGAGIALCGALEVRAAGRLKRRDARGLWIPWALQLTVLFLILNYAWFRWRTADGEVLLKLLPEFSREQLDALTPDRDEQRELLTLLFRIVAAAVGAGSVIFQGGLAAWYARGIPALRRALAKPARTAADISG